MLNSSILHGSVRPDLLKNETLSELFGNSVKRYADKVALTFIDQVYTYGELDLWSDQIAAYLQSQNIGAGDYVGLWWPRSATLHAAVIGITKSGAAYVPLDYEMPNERVSLVLKEAGAKCCFAQQALNSGLDVHHLPDFNSNDTHPTAIKRKATQDNFAYVLYTSGSTGLPKGIAITQKNICHFIRSENEVLQINADDRVYQGFSVSFDMWCEESWIGYFAGASIYVADATTAKAIDELAQFLNQYRITVLHAVPSLLAVVEGSVPSLRLINAGGEACPPKVVEKWATPQCQFFNSYGPTETTVTAACTELKPGQAVSIGRPLPNYHLAVVDEALNPVPIGEKGELVISGVGVAKGYLNRPELTLEKFVAKPNALSDMPGDTLYKTGDLVSLTNEGTVAFFGRLDDQIKLRGYRIELGEIEVKLSALPEVQSAAVAVKQDSQQQDQLVGYVVINHADAFNEAELRTQLALTLPVYMVPSCIVQLDKMPRITSGKVNRKVLPVPKQLQQTVGLSETIDLNSSVGEKVQSILGSIFPTKNTTQALGLEQDFFNDLGGHSLLAATFVSKMRNLAGVKHASLRDVYLHRPLSALIEVWQKAEQLVTAPPTQQKPRYSASSLSYWLCSFSQTLALLPIYSVFAAQIFLPYLVYYYVQNDTGSHINAIIFSFVAFCVLPPLVLGIGIISKWLFIGRFKEGDYPIWGLYFFRWWLVKNFQRLVFGQYLKGTPLFPMALKLFGADVASSAYLSNIDIGAHDLIKIGKNATISSGVVFNNAVIEGGWLKIRRIEIGENAYVGVNAVIDGNTVIGPHAELMDLGHLPSGKRMGDREIWQGSPAQYLSKKELCQIHPAYSVHAVKKTRYVLKYLIALFFIPLVLLVPLLPTVITFSELDSAAVDYNFSYLVYAPLLALVYVVLYTLQTVIIHWALMRNIKPGAYSIYSWTYFRKWLSDQIVSLSLVVIYPFFASVYVSQLFRWLDAKIGFRTEISTASSVTHSMLSIGEESFIADAVSLGESEVRNGQLVLGPTHIGNRSFVGNSALIPQGYYLPDDMLIGVLSTPPSVEQLKNSSTKDWFGVPAIALPNRQTSGDYPDELTTHPTKIRFLMRASIESIRIILPQLIVIISSTLLVTFLHDILTSEAPLNILWRLPLYYLGFVGIPLFATVCILKWALIGRYHKTQHPMWTYPVWISEAVTTYYNALCAPFLLNFMQGTLWLPFFLRLLGAKIGRRVFLDTTDFTEFDMVTIGDETELNHMSGPQTHLFEDRVMKIGSVVMGDYCCIGARSIILYDTLIGNDVYIDSLSLVMKGEQLAGNTRWTGSPIRPLA
ncbi:MAG: amino acid adenylation domain-containing protein [Methylophilaceae bacterium]|nr:amino acid adenylation domain-containing protein [Methylophilaceae bacterium]